MDEERAQLRACGLRLLLCGATPQNAPLCRGPAALQPPRAAHRQGPAGVGLPCAQASLLPQAPPRRRGAGARAFSIASAVFTGTVDFSTTILLVVDTEAIMRAAPSQYVRSAALPAPTPRVLVGVFTLRARRRAAQGPAQGPRGARGAERGPRSVGGAEQEGGRGGRRRARRASAAREAAAALSHPRRAPSLRRGGRLTELPWPWLRGRRRACWSPG
jgi:hypothetical protein